jgi:transposase
MEIVPEVQSVWKRLTKKEQRWLKSQAMSSFDAGLRVRCKIVRNLVKGKSANIIHDVLGCSRSEVYRVAHRFIADGLTGLVDRREENGESKVDEAYVSVVLAAVEGSPREHGYERPTWTQELFVLVAARETGVQVSTSTMCRLLKRLKIRRGRPKPIVHCPWPKARKTRRLNEIQRLAERLPADEIMVYVDEVDIHLNPKIGDDWMLQGRQKQVLTPGKNEKRYLAGALNTATGRLDWVEGARKTSDLFIALVDHLARRYRKAKKIHLVLDNFRIHSSKAVQASKARWGTRVVLHFLPPYCPDHNRIERTWKDLHDNVTRNHTCQDMDELMACVTSYLNQRARKGRHHYAHAA